MASIFAKRALRDIAQGMSKKKTEEELRKETDAYLFDRRAAAERDAVLEQKRNAYARYIADQHPSLPTDAATRENVMYSVGTRTPEMHEYEHAIRYLQGNREANEANARARAYEKSNPDAKRATDALYSLFNDKAVVNPLGDPAQLRYMEQLHRNKAAGYETGSWEAVQRGVRSTMTADEMARQAGIMENPLRELENVNRQIETLEGTRTSAFWAEEDNKKQVDDALEKLGRQRILLEAALTEDPVKSAKDERDPLTIQSGQNGRGGASRYDQEQLRSLANYLKYMPDGLTLDDYEPETIGMTIMLTAQEKQKYENLRAQDPAKAQEYLRAMESIINERKAQADAGFAEEFTERAPVAANLVATAANVLSPIGSVYATVQQLRGEDVDPNSPWFGADRLSGTVRGKTEQMIDDSIDSEGWSKAAKFMYNAGTSAIDNGLRMLINKGIGLGGNMSTALMAYGGYGNSVRDVLEGGGTQEQAMMVGIANAVSEFATEVLPEKMFMRSMSDISTKGWKKFSRDMLEAVMGDGLGEAANSMISTVADQAIRGYGGKIAMAADKYLYDGVAKSAQEAYKLAWKDALGSAMYEGLLGAVSAGLLEGGIDVVTSTVASGRDKKQQLEELAREKEAQEQQAQQLVPEAQQETTLESIAEDVNLKPAAQATGTMTVKTPEEVRAAKPVETKKTEEKAEKRRKAGLEVAVGDEGYTIKKDGETANMDDLDAGDADAQMLHNAEGMSAEAANDMLSLYDEKGETGAKDYAKGYKAAYEAGVKGEAFEDTGKLFAGDLTESQRRSAWEMGKIARTEANTRAEHLTRQHAARNGFRARSMADGVSFENVQSEITAAEKSTFTLLDAFGKRWGLNIRIYDTLEGGRANASYLSGTNVVNIARDAEGGALVRAASHEVYHYLEQFAKDDAQKIRTFVLDKLRSNEEYDLEGELQKYRDRYENVQDADVEAELVADSLLDVIGTEENIRAMAQDSPNLLNRIVDVIKRIREYLRGQLERLSRTSETVAMMMQDEAALAEVQRMAEEGLANAKANRDAQSRVMSTAMQDSAVQQYMEDVGKAGNDAERAGYLESLAQQTYARTQAQVYGQTGDYDGGFDVFRSVLKDFADGKGALNTLLKDAGLAESQSQQDNAVMAFIGRELKRVDESGVRNVFYSEKDENVEVNEYYEREVRRWNPENKRGFFKVGKIKADSVYAKVGLEPGKLLFDQSKAAYALNEHGDHIDKDTLIRVPKMLNNPEIIAKPLDKQKKNTINVFVKDEEYDEYPMMIGIMMLPDNTGEYYVDKVRTMQMRSNYQNLINEETILWMKPLDENSPSWRHNGKDYTVLTAATKDGLIRRITYEHDVVNTVQFKKWFKKSPFKDKSGKPQVYYHGTPYGGFDTFKNWSYFTTDKEYADKYHNPSASSIRGKYSEATKPETYAVYLTAKNVFDTRDPETQKVWQEQFYDHYSRTPLTERGVPDWTDGIDLIEFFEDNDLDYDAIVLDEGGTGGYGEDVTDRGLSVVVKNSNQVKSLNNVGSFDANTGNIYHSRKDADDATFFAEIATEDEVREAGKLINKLVKMRKENKVETGAWIGKTGELSKKLLEDTYSSMNQGVLTRRINTMYKAMDEGNVTPNQLMEYAYAIAEKVAEGAGQVQELGEGEREARNYIRGVRIYLTEDMQSEVRTRYGSLRSFYNRNFGRAKFTTNKQATSLEEMWPVLHNMAPGYFPEDTAVSDMPEVLEAFLEATGKVNRDYFGASEEQLKQDVAMRLFWNYYQMPGTYSHLRQQEKEMVERMSDMMESMRETFEQRVQDRVESFKQREEKERQRTVLDRNIKAMTKRLLKPTKNQHIPDEMRGAVASMLEIVNTSGSKKGQEARTKAYAQLQAAIAELRKTDVGYAYVDPDMEAYLQELKEKSGNKSVMSMNLQELKDLNKVISGIRHACTVADQLLTAGHKGSVAAIADDARSALDSMKDRKVRSDLANMATRFGKYAMEDAPRFFRDMARYTGKAGKALWDIVRHGGLDTQIRLLKEAENRVGEIHQKYKGYEQWMSRNSESKSFITESGEIELTTGQIMALYLLNKRKQARSHIYGIQGNDGGIAQKRVNTKNGARESVRPCKVNEAQVDYIIGTLTKEQKAFADEMSALLNGWCSDLGNEVSMLMYGYKKYTEKNYFPIEVWGGRKDATSGEERQNQLYLVMNKGFTKEVQDKAQAPLVIPDMFDAVTEHINGMIVYNAWTAPVTDMIKFINHKFRDDSVTMDQNGMEVFAPGQNIIGTVKEDLSRVMGEGAERWYVQLIEDINGLAKNKVEKDVTGFINKLTRNFKATAVGYNIGTMLKQPTSVIRAFDVIPPLYFAGKPVVPNKERQAIMEKYAPIVTWKGYGNFTMDTGKSIERILFPESSTKLERFNEWGMAGAGYMDTVTWHNIWAAAERMAAKQNKELQRGTDAFYKKTAEIFNQCIDQTQTVDSILHRTQLMRQDTAWIKSVTTFMGEPMKSYNMLLDAVNAWKTQSSKERARTVSKAAGIFAVNAATAAFVNSLISALRNWDDEDPFWQQVWQKMFGQYDEDMTTSEKFMEAILGSNLAGELNILNYIPIARDVVETFAGYDVERVDMSLFADVRDAVEALKSEKTATPEKIMDLVGALASFVGIPVNNVMMESKRIWNWYNQQMEVFGLDTLDSQYAFLRAQKNIGASGNLTDYANLLLKAEAEGRTDLVKKIRQDMLEAGLEAEDVDSKLYKTDVERLTGIKNASYAKTYAALGMAIRAGDEELVKSLTAALKRADRTDEQIADGLAEWLTEDPRVISAAQKAADGDVSEKAMLAATLRSEGFDDAVGKRAINRAQDRIIDERKKAETPAKEETKKEPTYEALYTYYDLQTAIEDGDGVSEIMADLRKQGKTDSTIKSQITSRIKPVYVALMRGTPSDKAHARKIKEQLLKLDLENRYTEEAIDKWLK